MADACCSSKRDTIAELGRKAEQRRVLIIVMLINLAMFVVEFGGGVVAFLCLDGGFGRHVRRRGGLCAQSLCIASGCALGGGAALAKGGIILAFGVAVIFEIADKIANGVPPASGLMLGVGSAALVANLICLALLWRFRRENVNMSSTFECSRNDVASNVGVLAAAGLVGLTGSAAGHHRRRVDRRDLPALGMARDWEAWPAWRAAKAPARELLQ
jgi:hypothetical protein